jgi:hypothetical protein
MIDGDKRAGGLRGTKDTVDGRGIFGFGAEVDEAGGTEDVCVPGVGRDLPAGDQQELIEIRLQLTLGVVVRDGVVVGDGDEVQLLLHRVLDGDEDRAWDHLSGLAGAGAIAVRGVHVEVAAIPALAGGERCGGKAGGINFICSYKVNVSLLVQDVAFSEISDADEQLPRARPEAAARADRRALHPRCRC